MRDDEHPIDSYISQLAQRLHLPAIERDQVLAEVHAHLEERAGALHETGVSAEQAERQAVQAFGPVGRISQELRATHPIAWGARRWIVGMLAGAVVLYALYLVDCVPVVIHYYSTTTLPPLNPRVIGDFWNWSTGDLVRYMWSDQSGLVGALGVFLPVLVLYPVLPFRWGRRAQHWWVPGLAYGLGTGLLVIVELFNVMVYTWWITLSRPVLYFPFYINIMPFARISALSLIAWISALSLTLALAASFVGWWRERSAAALARAQAA